MATTTPGAPNDEDQEPSRLWLARNAPLVVGFFFVVIFVLPQLLTR